MPDVPTTKRAVNLLAERDGWSHQPGAVRRRAGRGGGIEYHWSLLPVAAQRALLIRVEEAEQGTTPDSKAMWAEFERKSSKARAKAMERLEIVRLVSQLRAGGAAKNVAVVDAAKMHNVSPRSIYNWLEMLVGVSEGDHLPALAASHKTTQRQSVATVCDRAFMDHLKSLYLRLEQPSFAHCHRLAMKEAKRKGWSTLTLKTAQRRVETEVPRVTRVFMREGVSGLERCFPAQLRDRSAMHAMEGVNADCHKIDVFVSWPDGRITRPQIVAFQDIYSGKILSWRVDHDPNKVMVMSAFAEMVEQYGLPENCLFDNGREFANKWMTGGTPTRFRFKVREDDPIGVLPLLGVKVHWAKPAHGQAKPIERAFRDIASDVAKDPRFEGAYVGHKPDAKPENYASRAVPIDTFLRVLDEGICEHNAREGRTSHTADGRSFDVTFAESYASASIRKATEEQRRLWLMGQQNVRLRKTDGQVRLYNNWYHSA